MVWSDWGHDNLVLLCPDTVSLMDDTRATLFRTRVVGITGIRSWPRTEIRMSRSVMNSIMIKVKYTENENIYRKYIIFIGKVRT